MPWRRSRPDLHGKRAVRRWALCRAKPGSVELPILFALMGADEELALPTGPGNILHSQDYNIGIMGDRPCVLQRTGKSTWEDVFSGPEEQAAAFLQGRVPDSAIRRARQWWSQYL
jgi:hypothetical protein